MNVPRYPLVQAGTQRTLALALLAALCACRTGAPARPQTQVQFAPVGPGPAAAQAIAPERAADVEAPPLQLADGPSTAPARPSAPRIDLDYDGTDVRDAVREVSAKYGLNVTIDSAVHGPVSVHSRNVTIQEALQALLGARGYAYTMQGPTLVVTTKRPETRIFTLNYPAMTRVASGNTSITRQFQGSGNNAAIQAGSAQAASTGAGGDVIQGYSDADIWNEVRLGLETMLFPPGTADVSRTTGVEAGSTAAGTPPTGRCAPDGTCLSITPVAGLIQVTASPDRMDRVATWLNAYESSIQRQVLIEAKIVEVDLTNANQFGIDWTAVLSQAKSVFGVSNNPAGLPSNASLACPSTVCFQFTGGNLSINSVLTALRSQGKVDVLSDPEVLALNNQRASLNVTTDANFFATTQVPITGAAGNTISYNTQVQIQQVAVGIVLDVTPEIAPDNTMTMSIRPLVTSLDRVDTFRSGGASATAPVTSRREADTMAKLRAGETVVIGGLTQTRSNVERGGVPGLMNVPWIGKLFSQYQTTHTRSELVIFLTPTIVAGQPPAVR